MVYRRIKHNNQQRDSTACLLPGINRPKKMLHCFLFLFRFSSLWWNKNASLSWFRVNQNQKSFTYQIEQHFGWLQNQKYAGTARRLIVLRSDDFCCSSFLDYIWYGKQRKQKQNKTMRIDNVLEHEHLIFQWYLVWKTDDKMMREKNGSVAAIEWLWYLRKNAQNVLDPSLNRLQRISNLRLSEPNRIGSDRNRTKLSGIDTHTHTPLMCTY